MTSRRSHVTAFAAVMALALPACGRDEAPSAQAYSWPAGDAAEIEQAITPTAAPGERDGLAAAILIDVSGSMARAPRRAGEPKIVSARRAAVDIVSHFARYADAHPGETVLLGIYEFSSRNTGTDVREVMAMGAPDPARATEAMATMQPSGGTPIGDAMIAGKRALDATGLSRRHLLVVTDGENTDSYAPGAVAAAIGRRPEIERPSMYFVAFDITAQRFEDVKDAGALVLEAADSRGLNETLDTLVSGQILVER